MSREGDEGHEGESDFRLWTPAVVHPPRREKAGVKWYFIEDESPIAAEQIPQSLRYLEQVKW